MRKVAETELPNGYVVCSTAIDFDISFNNYINYLHRSFHISLSANTWSCGKELIGTLTLNLDSPSLLRGLWVKLTGYNKIKGRKGDCIDLLKDEIDYHCGGLHQVFLGFGEDDDDNGNLIEIQSGSQSWLFSFYLPEDLPASYCDEYADVSYMLSAVFDTPLASIKATTISYNIIIEGVNSEGLDKILVAKKDVIGLHKGKLESIVEKPRSYFQKLKSRYLKEKNEAKLAVESLSDVATYPFQTGSNQLEIQCSVSGVEDISDVFISAGINYLFI